MKLNPNYLLKCCHVSTDGKECREWWDGRRQAAWEETIPGVSRGLPVPRRGRAYLKYSAKAHLLRYTSPSHTWRWRGALARPAGSFIQENVRRSALPHRAQHLMSRCYAEKRPCPTESATAALNYLWILMTAGDLRSVIHTKCFTGVPSSSCRRLFPPIV